jgi:hypothetical protein
MVAVLHKSETIGGQRLFEDMHVEVATCFGKKI